MKKLITALFILVLSSQAGAQVHRGANPIALNPDSIYAGDPDNFVSKTILIGSLSTTADYPKLFHVSIPMSTCCLYDSLNFLYLEYRDHSERNPKEATWSAKLTSDTVRFVIPPKHMIIGNNSYTSMFLNGNWYFLMDPTNLK